MTIRCLVCDHNDAGHRYACDTCIQHTQRQLREIGTYWDDALPALTTPTRGAPGRGAPGYASRSPARDDVLVMLDIRSSGNHYGPDDTDQPVVSIPAAIHHMVTWVRQEDPAPPRKRGGIGYLLARVPHVAMTKSIALLASQVRTLHAQARALAHDQPPRRLGTCRTCNGDVYPATVGARCNSCQHTYTGLDLYRLHQAQEAAMDAIRQRLAAVADIDWTPIEFQREAEHYGDWISVGPVLIATELTRDPDGYDYPDTEAKAIAEFIQHAVEDLRRLLKEGRLTKEAS